MLFSHLLQGLLFYLVFSLFALIGLPLTSRLFAGKLTAYATSKLAGLVLFGYGIWFLSTIRLVNYQSYFLIAGLFVMLCGVSLYFSRGFFMGRPDAETAGKARKKQAAAPQPLWKRILLLESVVAACYVAYLLLRSHFPDINGTERFMDLALLSAAGKTEYFPFIDPWYAGKTVNYYYHGSYLMSLVSNLSRLPYELTYNFSLGLIFSQVLLLAGTLGTVLSKSKLAGVFAAFMTAIAGTLFYAGCVLNGLFKTPQTICSYASSTRLYTPSYIINEIPSYSFTVGDLHAHFLALPFFLLNLLLIWSFVKAERPGLTAGLLLAVGMATSGMINAWDAVTLVCLLIIAGGIKFIHQHGTRAWVGAVSIASALALMIPNLIHFKSPVLGLGFIPSYVAQYQLENVQWPTPLLATLGMWGALGAGILIAMAAKRKNIRQIPFQLALVILSVGILVGVEIVFIKDIYSVSNANYFRANTTFKFGYHAWTMLSVAFAGLVFPIVRQKHNQRFSWDTRLNLVIIVVAVAGGLFYPYQAAKQFYLYDQPGRVLSLNGSDWIEKDMSDDAATIDYINNNINRRAVIAEAVGDSYTTYGRMATYTGMIAPMGWSSHEWTWRLDAEAAKQAAPGIQVETGWSQIAQVMGDIENLYTLASVDETAAIIDKYEIEFVYVGHLEYERYPDLNIDKFYELGTPVFTAGNAVLFQTN